MSATSFSLHIGINGVDKIHYQGWDGKLYGCENDAFFYSQLAKKEGCIVSRVLVNSDQTNTPTAANVLGFLDRGIAELKAGDSLFITYSGHGGILEDVNFDEDDFQDETWCLYDRQLLDDELFTRFSQFREGVNIIVLSDSCHSGSIVKGCDDKAVKIQYRQRVVPRQQLFTTYYANKEIYQPLMRRPIVRYKDIPAAVLQLGACQDDECAMEDDQHGLFTRTIMNILQKNSDMHSYEELFVRTKRALSGVQKPNLVSYGKDHHQLLTCRPFGGTYTTTTNVCINLIEATNKFVIELKPAGELMLDGVGLLEKTATAGTEGYTRYYCKLTGSGPASHPWDLAYRQYNFLKQKQFDVRWVEPDFCPIGEPDRSDVPWDSVADVKFPSDHDKINVLIKTISDQLGGRKKNTRGIGRVGHEQDPVLLKMFSAEILYVMDRDHDLARYRSMPYSALAAFLSEESNFDEFVWAINNSLVSSDTLTTHL